MKTDCLHAEYQLLNAHLTGVLSGESSSAYHQGMHDGLRFAKNALAATLDRHGDKENLLDSPSSVALMEA